MATTSPDNIWTPDAGDDYALTVDLAAMADSVQNALKTRDGVNAAVSLGVYWKNHPDWQPLTLTKTGNVVTLTGVATLSQNVLLAANTAYTVCTVPSGYRPPSNGYRGFYPVSFSPLSTGYGWASVSPTGAVDFAVSNTTNQLANEWLIGINLRWFLS